MRSPIGVSVLYVRQKIMSQSKQTRIASYALIRNANEVLLCRLSKQLPKWEGYWTLSGGGIEFGESPEEAMIREVEEETGLLVAPKSIAKIDTILDRTDKREFHGIRIIYEVEIMGGSLRSELSGTTDLCEWHTIHPSPRINLVDLAEVGLDYMQNQQAEQGSAHQSTTAP